MTWEDAGWDGPQRRIGREVTTRDVADLLQVTPACVRQWVARGYLNPVRKLGPSHVFRTADVCAARDQIWKRRKATSDTGPIPGEDKWSHPNIHRPMDQIPYKDRDTAITIDEAAALIGVSTSTIRSWIHRGHLVPLPSSTPRSTRLRTGDVVSAAHGRRLPRHLPPTWRDPTR